MEQESSKLNEIVEPVFGSEVLSEEKPKKKKKAKAPKKVEEPLIEGQVIGGKILSTGHGKLLHTKERVVAEFANKGDAIVASKRYGGRAKPSNNGFIVKA